LLSGADATVGKRFYSDFGMEAREFDKRIVMLFWPRSGPPGPDRGKQSNDDAFVELAGLHAEME